MKKYAWLPGWNEPKGYFQIKLPLILMALLMNQYFNVMFKLMRNLYKVPFLEIIEADN